MCREEDFGLNQNKGGEQPRAISGLMYPESARPARRAVVPNKSIT